MKIKDQLRALLEQARDIAATAEAADREYTADERADLARLLDEAKAVRDQIKVADGDAALKASILALGDGIDFTPAPNGTNGTNGHQPPAGGLLVPARGKSLGEQFTESAEFRDWFGRVAPAGHIPEGAKGLMSPPIQFKTLLTGGSETSAGAMVTNQFYPQIDTFRRTPTVRDVITVGQTSSDAVEFAQVTGETNAAAPVAEATATTGTSGTKPESGLTFAKVVAPVRTIAHWIPATKRSISDAGQLRTLIDAFLRAGLEEELEDQIITGDGTGENFLGISNTSGIQTQAFATDLLTTYRKARTKVQTVGHDRPNAYLVNPIDWEAVDLLQDNEARYYFGGPMTLGTPRLWGLPVVESEGVTAGTAFVGNFKQAVLWDREQASITVSDSHSDFFVRNLIAILAEMRAAFGVLHPASIVKIALS